MAPFTQVSGCLLRCAFRKVRCLKPNTQAALTKRTPMMHPHARKFFCRKYGTVVAWPVAVVVSSYDNWYLRRLDSLCMEGQRNSYCKHPRFAAHAAELRACGSGTLQTRLWVPAARTFREPRRFETERVNRAHTHMPANLTSSLLRVRHGSRLAGFMIGAPSRLLACGALQGPENYRTGRISKLAKSVLGEICHGKARVSAISPALGADILSKGRLCVLFVPPFGIFWSTCEHLLISVDCFRLKFRLLPFS